MVFAFQRLKVLRPMYPLIGVLRYSSWKRSIKLTDELEGEGSSKKNKTKQKPKESSSDP